MQQALNRHGSHLAVDGGYGPLTAAAVRTWKVAHDMNDSTDVGLRAWLSCGSLPS